MINEFDTSPMASSDNNKSTGDISDSGTRANGDTSPSKIGGAPIDTDNARLGLVKEMLQVVMGLEPAVMERVLRLIRGSADAADIKTPNMRQRIGPRAMDYLRNAIDLARNEGNEYHNTDPDIDMSKNVNIEPGHKHNRGLGKFKQQMQKMMSRGKANSMATEGVNFKDYLVAEATMDVDLSDPAVASNQVRQAAQMGPDRAARQEVKNARDNMSTAQDQDQASQTKQIDLKIAALSQQLAILQQRKQQMLQSMDTGQQ